MFRGDLAHTAVYSDTGIVHLAGVKWWFHTSGRAIASPAIAGRTGYVGSPDGNLKPDGTIDVAGKHFEPFYDTMVALVEKQFTLGAILSSPVIVDRTLYVGSADRNLYAPY
jgi:hypothetical protein